jgi:hypothetical protein
MKVFGTILVVFGISMLVPRAGAETPSPLPSLQTVLQNVMQTSAQETPQYHIFNQHYYYLRDKVTDFFDGDGNLKSRQDSLSTNNPVPPAAIHKPQPATRRIAYGKQGETGASINGVNLGKKEDLLNPDLVKRYTLTIVGRQTINGRPTLVVDFKPASSDLPIFNIKDRFLNCVAGRAWVDEAEYQLEKVDLHLTQKVSVLGGLAGSVSKFTFSFDRERTPDGYWYTRYMHWHLEAHEATIARVVDHFEQVTNLQKMR